MTRFFLFFFYLIFIHIHLQAQSPRPIFEAEESGPGISETKSYLPLIKGKNIGVIANQTSIYHNTHLIDTLVSEGIIVKKIFSPEHGFRGNIGEGLHISNGIDDKTGIEIISLYGNNKKPKAEQLNDIDILLFDLQDVGTRFYTYISTLTYVMEAAAENDIPVIVLDRPNPNGFYIDGPVLESENSSFVGMNEIPIVYGLTIGEYAMMVNGESWLKDGIKCDLTVIPMSNYDRRAIYKLPVKPSPNLPNWESVYLYPSLCLFEGTVVSVGRGTDKPFQIYGHPQIKGDFSFTPKNNNSGAVLLYENELCHGENLNKYAHDNKDHEGKIVLDWLVDSYNQLKDKEVFFNNYFIKLSGTKSLQNQIESGENIKKIRISWKDGIEKYRKIRIKYLLYPDF